jgi:hypothetical protein
MEGTRTSGDKSTAKEIAMACELLETSASPSQEVAA